MTLFHLENLRSEAERKNTVVIGLVIGNIAHQQCLKLAPVYHGLKTGLAEPSSQSYKQTDTQTGGSLTTDVYTVYSSPKEAQLFSPCRLVYVYTHTQTHSLILIGTYFTVVLTAMFGLKEKENFNIVLLY